tara:strand:+ start:156 stop:1481 length:1326 start_codon:yes stop_codon:yes gene_type:complete
MLMCRRSALVLALLSASALSAHAGVFAVNEYAASDLGRANTGRVTQTDDPSAAFGNPALMTGFSQPQVSFNASGILGNAQYEDGGSVDALGNPLGGNTDGFLSDSFLPSGHAIYPLNDRLAVGLSVTVPFGLSTNYHKDWPGRYQALTSELKTININPGIAYKLTDTLSIGAGISAQYAKARLTSAIDFGAVCFSQVNPVTCAGAGDTPQMADGSVEIEGEDWKFGWNAGLAWAPHPDWLIGLHYRSRIDQNLEGDANFTVPANAAFLTSGGAFADTDAQAALKLPATTELGVRWQATDRTTLYANAQWTEWSSIQELRVRFDNPAQPDSVDELKYDDAGRYGIGADYRLSDQWTVRAGYALDKSPAKAMNRTARIPDNDRNILAVGATWKPNAAWSVNAGYNRVTIKNTDFSRTGSFADTVTGMYSGNADVISVGATRRF